MIIERKERPAGYHMLYGMKFSHVSNMKGSYQKLYISLVISFVVMYTVMFLNVDDFSHVFLSLNRSYMALLMVSPMAIIMILLMRSMYTDKRLNLVIVFSSIIVFILSLVCLRTQAFISDVQYMKGMIPHHSSAIMTSRHASIHDLSVKALSDSIIRSQEEEIRQMKSLIKKLSE